MTTEAQKRAVANHTKRLVESGGKIVTIKLTPEYAEKLRALAQQHGGTTEVIRRGIDMLHAQL